MSNKSTDNLVPTRKYDGCYVWGWNNSQLCVKSKDETISTPEFLSNPIFKDYLLLETGGSHSVLVTKDYKVFVWGKNQCGQLGIEGKLQSPEPVELKSNLFNQKNNRVINIACGDRHTILVTEKNHVIGFGGNFNGQLGLGNTVNSLKPTIIAALTGKFIVRAYCGSRHTIFLDSKGSVYSCGWGYYGQLGHGNNVDQLFPKLIVFPKDKIKFIQISCKEHITVGLTEDFQVIMWGGKKYNPLVDDEFFGNNSPTIVIQKSLVGTRVVQVCASALHCMARTNDGSVFVWGHNLKNTGYSKYIEKLYYSSSKALDEDDSKKSSGEIDFLKKKLNVGNKYVIKNPVSSKGEKSKHHDKFIIFKNHFFKDKVVYISCTESTNFIVNEKGQVFSWGKANNGELGIEKQGKNEPMTTLDYPTLIHTFKNENGEEFKEGGGPSICKIVCGSWHTFALVGDTKENHNIDYYRPGFVIKRTKKKEEK